jgi:heterokaryon incompatibility protein (HET)
VHCSFSDALPQTTTTPTSSFEPHLWRPIGIITIQLDTRYHYILSRAFTMRLLNTSSLEFAEFLGDNMPQYAILSHRWEAEEVTYQDMQQSRGPQMKGYSKITNCCRQAKKDGYSFTWIDSCCIDKSSSAELSEAINSMFQWYSRPRVCYVFLSDALCIANRIYLHQLCSPPQKPASAKEVSSALNCPQS